MSLLVKTDLKTHVYTEILDAITRSDDTIIQEAIDNGEEEAKSYLNRYDIATMFVADYANKFLRSIVKDIVCWHLVKLANPNINLELFRTLYEDAIKTLQGVARGQLDPQWPLRADDANTNYDDAGNIDFVSDCKRKNNY